MGTFLDGETEPRGGRFPQAKSETFFPSVSLKRLYGQARSPSSFCTERATRGLAPGAHSAAPMTWFHPQARPRARGALCVALSGGTGDAAGHGGRGLQPAEAERPDPGSPCPLRSLAVAVPAPVGRGTWLGDRACLPHPVRPPRKNWAAPAGPVGGGRGEGGRGQRLSRQDHRFPAAAEAPAALG